jgi:putative selenium metabolism hydrolase
VTPDPAFRPVTLCQELVRLESLSGREGAVADAVEREMRSLGYDEVQRDELGSVVGVVRGARVGGCTLIDAHMDVVAATQPDEWRFPPFSGELAEGRVWGRGATDVKGSLAAAVVAVGGLPRAELAGTVVMSASVGEELVEGLAVKRVLQRNPAQAVVICEPTGLQLGMGHRGRASLVVTAAGKAAHTSRPENGINAVYRLCDAIACIRAMPRRPDALLGAGNIVLVEVSSEPFPASSMVPYEAVARFDRRLVRGETRDGVLGEMRAALAAVEGVTVSLHDGGLRCYTGADHQVEAFHPGWAVEPDSDFERRALSALERAGLAHEVFYAPYCTNGSATAGELGIPTVVYGAGEIREAHAVNESVAVEDLLAACRGYRALALGLCG